MKKSIRIYREHDIDLVTLYKNPEFGFQKALKQAVRAYVRGTPYLIYAPQTQDISKKDYKYGYQIFITFDEKYDADVIEWLKTLKPRCFTKALKTILRGSLIGPVAYGCFKTDEDRQRSDSINQKIKDIISEGKLNEIISSPPLRKETKYPKKKNTSGNAHTKNKTTAKTENNDAIVKIKKYNNKQEINANKNTIDDTSSIDVKNTTYAVKPTVQMVEKKYTADENNTNASVDTMPNTKENDIPAVKTVTSNNEETDKRQPASNVFPGLSGFGDYEDTQADQTENQDNNADTDDFDLFASADSLISQFM